MGPKAEARLYDGHAYMCDLDGGIWWETPESYGFCVYPDGYIICDGVGWCEWRPN